MWSFGSAPDGFRETIENSQVSLKFEWFIGSINIIHAEWRQNQPFAGVVDVNNKDYTFGIFIKPSSLYKCSETNRKIQKKTPWWDLFFNKFAFFYEVCKFLQNSFILAKHSWWLLLVKRLPPLEIVFAIFNHLDSIQIITHSG